jgi:hypothetical protein
VNECKRCPAKFLTLSELFRHTKAHHHREPPEDDRPPRVVVMHETEYRDLTNLIVRHGKAVVHQIIDIIGDHG